MIYTFGNRYCDAPEWTTEFAKNNNYKKIDKEIEKQINQVINDISENKKEIPVPSDWDREHTKDLEKFNLEKPEFNNGSQIEVTDKCVKCGICSKVCPVGNIMIEEDSKKATRKRKECEFSWLVQIIVQ